MYRQKPIPVPKVHDTSAALRCRFAGTSNRRRQPVRVSQVHHAERPPLFVTDWLRRRVSRGSSATEDTCLRRLVNNFPLSYQPGHRYHTTLGDNRGTRVRTTYPNSTAQVRRHANASAHVTITLPHQSVQFHTVCIQPV